MDLWKGRLLISQATKIIYNLVVLLCLCGSGVCVEETQKGFWSQTDVGLKPSQLCDVG
jgi:hypothetical protein